MISLLGHLEVFGPDDELVGSGFVLPNALLKFQMVGHTEDGEPVLLGQHMVVEPPQVQQALQEYRSIHAHIESATSCNCAPMRTTWQEARSPAWRPES